jgi:hypothetical protein
MLDLIGRQSIVYDTVHRLRRVQKYTEERCMSFWPHLEPWSFQAVSASGAQRPDSGPHIVWEAQRPGSRLSCQMLVPELCSIGPDSWYVSNVFIIGAHQARVGPF